MRNWRYKNNMANISNLFLTAKWQPTILSLISLLLLSVLSLSVNSAEQGATSQNTHATIEHFLIGSYAKQQDQGVYWAEFDKQDKQLSLVKTVADTKDPTYLVWRQAEGILYSVTITDEKRQAGVNVFRWNKQTQTFDLLQTLSAPGRGSCHISFNENTKQVAVANYVTGDIQLYQADENTHLLSKQGYFKNTGKSILPRQKSSHLHFSNWHSGDQYLYVNDLGTDEILVFDTSKELTLINRVKLNAGDGPRHFAIHPTLAVLYSLNELSNTIASFDMQTNGQLVNKQRVNLLTAAVTNQTASAIRISNDGKFLYAGVRGDDVINVYQIDEQGSLTFIQRMATGGKHPRDFNFSAQQDYILVANTHSDTVTLLWRNHATGKLTASNIVMSVSEPSYIGVFH